ncbi:MAG: cytochrome P450 [Myxococcota bacterium]
MTAASSLASELPPIIHPARIASAGYPHDAWRTLRATDPVRRFEDGPVPFWALTKHADIMEVGKNPETFLSAPRLVITPNDRGDFRPPPTLIEMDGEKHRAYRRIISSRFTPRALKKIHADIDRIAKKIVDDMLAHGGREVDFVEQVSAPLPIAVIAWLLGVPESDWKLLFEWTNRTIGADDPEYNVDGVPGVEAAQKAIFETFQYFAKLVEERKKDPKDDLVSLFAHAEVDGQKLDPIDVLAYCQIIVVAGNETTRNATTGGMLALIEHQAELRKVQQDPALLGSAIEEILRWVSPIIHFARTASRDTVLRGRKIREGDHLALFYPSANRDEDVFDRPDVFDVARSPNRHIAFGIGEHFCAGAHLARLELEYAFKYLLPRIDEIELTGPVERLRSNLVGGIKHLPVRYSLKPAGR